MAPEEAEKKIQINATYQVKDSPGLPKIATVDTLTELDDGKTEVTYHYNNERKSMWFLTAEEFVHKFGCK